MSTPYNNQWMLGRRRVRRGGPALVASGGALGQPRERERQEPQEPLERHEPHEANGPHTSRERAPGAHEGVRTTLPRAVRKRPRWIDRDT